MRSRHDNEAWRGRGVHLTEEPVTTVRCHHGGKTLADHNQIDIAALPAGSDEPISDCREPRDFLHPGQLFRWRVWVMGRCERGGLEFEVWSFQFEV